LTTTDTSTGTETDTPTETETPTETVVEPTETTEPTETVEAESPATETAAGTEVTEVTDDTEEAPAETPAGGTAATSRTTAAPASSAGASEAPPARPAKPICQTTGRRKRAVARVRLRPGNGKITVNRRAFEAYFTSATHRMIVGEPLRISNIADRYDIDATIDGGGVAGQAGALRLGITRALIVIDPELRTNLKRAGLLTRDAREKESKKYGLKKARKAPQYSKR
jgi:small subunit ribosomal protein S9